MELTHTLHVTTREEWREWLAEHGPTEKEIWLIFDKPHTGRPALPYEDSVEEALCFGWIDSLIQKIDEDRYARKFTPRKPGSRWSATNLRRAGKVLREGRMTEAGRVLLPEGLTADTADAMAAAIPDNLPVPADLEAALQAAPPAWENFLRFTPKYQQTCIRFVSEVKRAESRAKRIQTLVERTALNRKLTMDD